MRNQTVDNSTSSKIKSPLLILLQWLIQAFKAFEAFQGFEAFQAYTADYLKSLNKRTSNNKNVGFYITYNDCRYFYHLSI